MEEKNLNIPKDYLLYLSHVFLRDFFYATARLGWVYLYFQGVALEILFFAFFTFRLLQVSIFFPLSLKLNKYFGYKVLFCVSIITSILYLCSFYFASENIYYLTLTVFLISMYDVIYWSTRKNLQRETVSQEHISTGVGYGKAVQIMTDAGGILFSSYVLYMFGGAAFIISALGIFASFIPIIFIKTHIKIQNIDFNIFRIFKKKELSSIKANTKICNNLSGYVVDFRYKIYYGYVHYIQTLFSAKSFSNFHRGVIYFIPPCFLGVL